jgi:outer membrane usher protein
MEEEWERAEELTPGRTIESAGSRPLPKLDLEPELFIEPGLLIEREFDLEQEEVADFGRPEPPGWKWRECAPSGFEGGPSHEGPLGVSHVLSRSGALSESGVFGDDYGNARSVTDCAPVEVTVASAVRVRAPEPFFASSGDPETADVFARVFGTRSKPWKQTLTVPLILDNRSKIDIGLHIGSDPSKTRLEAEPLLALLEPELRPDLYARLAASADEEGQVSLSALARLGVRARFDQSTLSLDVRLPPRSRKTRVISFRTASPPVSTGLLVEPSAFSGYLNSRLALDYVKDGSGLDRGLQPAQALFEGATNLRDWVLEGSLSYQEDAIHPWQRDEVRLVRDDPRRGIRFQVGDVSVPAFGFQGTRNLLGVTVERNFDLQPYRITEPSGSRRFTLTSPSKVEVSVNGKRVKTLHLRPGPYDLRDFRFTNGMNDVTILITDAFGREREVDFPFSFESRLLRKGLTEFAYTVGILSSRVEGLLEYDRSARVFSGFHRIGLSDRLTVGGHVQADRDRQLVGADAILASSHGTLSAETAVSRGRGTRPGYGVRVRYERYDARGTNRAKRRWRLSFESRGRTFAPIGVNSPDNATAMDIGAEVSQDLGRARARGTFSINYRVGRGGEPDTLDLVASVRKWLTRSLDLELRLGNTNSSDGTHELSSVVGLVWTNGERNQTARLTHESADRSTQLSWQYSPDRVVGGVAANADLVTRPEAYDLGGGLRYTGARLEAALSHDTTLARGSGWENAYRSNLQLGTAVAFAGKKLALSRPITNSFALVVPHPSLKGHVVGVDPAGGTTSSQADRFGAGVIPNLTPYKIRTVTVEAPDLPAGFDLGVSFFRAAPTYKSGLIVPVGRDAVVVMRGLLTLPDGEPMALEAGKVASIDDPDFEPVMFFTNRKGKFSVPGLKPGRYEVRMHSSPESPIRIDIPENTVGRYDVGGVRLPTAQVNP